VSDAWPSVCPGNISARHSDPDGVLTETAELHADAWNQAFD